MTEVNGKAAACVSGVLSVKRKAFVLEAPPVPSASASTQVGADGKVLKLAGKRKSSSSNPSMSPAATAINPQRVEYREKSSILLGQVDEDKLEKQVKTVRVSSLCRS